MRWHAVRPTADKLFQIEKFIEYFYPNQFAGQYPDAEDVLGMMDVIEVYNGIRSDMRGNRWRSGRIRDIRESLTRLLGEYLWSFQESLDAAVLGPLVEMVRHFGTHTVYVSFNYDLLLESALSLAGIKYTYGMHFPDGGVGILKPHGSINWFSLEHWLKSHPAIDYASLGSNSVITKTLDRTQLSFRNWKPPIIIAPSPNKQLELPELKKTWSQFSSVIHTSPKVISIGYSVPAADRLARLILRKAGPRHNDTRFITVVNPTAATETTYRDHVSTRLKFFQVTFHTWVTAGFPGT